MQFLVEVLAGKTGAVSMTVMSRVRSSIDDPGKNRSYAKVSPYTTSFVPDYRFFRAPCTRLPALCRFEYS
jgi:hypothetical protein